VFFDVTNFKTESFFDFTTITQGLEMSSSQIKFLSSTDEEVSMESRLLCRPLNLPLPSPTSHSQGDECEGAPGQQQHQQHLCRHQKRRQSPSAVNIQSGRCTINDDDQNESAFTTPTTSSKLMARPDHDNKAAAVMSDNSVAAADPVDNFNHLLPSQSGAGRTAEVSDKSGNGNDLHLLSSTVIFLGSSSDNDEPCSSNDDVINYPPTKAPSAIVVGKTTAGDADNLVTFKVILHSTRQIIKSYSNYGVYNFVYYYFINVVNIVVQSMTF